MKAHETFYTIFNLLKKMERHPFARKPLWRASEAWAKALVLVRPVATSTTAASRCPLQNTGACAKHMSSGQSKGWLPMSKLLLSLSVLTLAR